MKGSLNDIKLRSYVMGCIDIKFLKALYLYCVSDKYIYSLLINMLIFA